MIKYNNDLHKKTRHWRHCTNPPTQDSICWVTHHRFILILRKISATLVLQAKNNLNNSLNPLLRKHVLPMNNFLVLSPRVASFNIFPSPTISTLGKSWKISQTTSAGDLHEITIRENFALIPAREPSVAHVN